MAMPQGVSRWGWGDYRPTGVQLAAYPSTVHGVPIELAASTSIGFGSSVTATATIPPSTRGPLFYTYNLPLSTKRYYFKGRHNGGGYGAGAYTPIVSAKPVLIPQISLPMTLNAAGNVEFPGANILISSGNKPKVGSQNTTSYITKSIRYDGEQFTIAKTTYKRVNQLPGIAVGSTGTSGVYDCAVPMPLGSILSKITFQGTRRTTAGVTFKVTAYKISTIYASSFNIVAATALSTMTMTTGIANPISISSSDLSGLGLAFSSGINLLLRASMKTKASGTNPILYWADVQYRMPSYDKSY